MAEATALASVENHQRASRRLRQVQVELRKILADDQERPEIGYGVCEALGRIEEQLNRVIGLQELFEWYSQMPTR